MKTPVTPEAGKISALSTGAKPPRPSVVSCSLTFCWRAMLKIKHVPEQLFDVTALPIVFLLLFTYLFGGALAGSTGEYLQFVLPGILVMTVTFITTNTGLGIHNDVKKGVFDRVRSLPIWQPSFLVGALLGDTIRYTMAAAVLIVLGLILGFRPAAGTIEVFMSILLLLVFSFSLSWIWIALGLVVRSPESFQSISWTVLFLLTFISNVFVLPETMPGWLQSFVNVNPITHLVTAVRGFMSGEILMNAIGWVLITCVLLIALFGSVTMHLYRGKRA
ncbi:MAG: ABC transporter permease [Dehalococcoidia bacterium]|nr:ABC transporter permease [Dehalococcoidia bacterium]